MNHRPGLEGVRVLLVDDNEINREVALELLDAIGVQAVTADDGQQALQMLSRERFDGVLMDCRMPVMDGFAATRALREQPALRDLPVIAMTGDTYDSDREKALAAGMNDHIAKPIDLDDLATKLARWMLPRRTG